MRHRSVIIAALTAFLFSVGLGACAQTPTAPAPAGQPFSIIVLEGSWDSLQLGYTSDPAYAKLRTQMGGPRAATIAEVDIQSYHWARQTLTLTQAATARLLTELAVSASPDAEFAFDHRAVIVATGADATDFGAAARVYWTLKLLGLKELSILNGGMKAWADAKLAQDQAVPQVARSQYQPQIDTSLLATREDVGQHIKLSNAALVDSRPDAFFLGKTRAPAAKLAGTLPGAQQLDFNQWFVPGSATFVDKSAAQKIAAQVKREQGQDMAAFCNTGHWAATDWFGLSEVAGLPGVKLYAGSMVDWTQSKDTPLMANQPSRFEALAYDAKQWWERKSK